MGQMVLETTLLIILTVLAVNLTFRVFRLPVILGYLIAGSAAGPHGLSLITDTASIQHLAEFGVVLLMFTIGLEFSVSRIFKLKYAVFVMGSLQVILSILVTLSIGYLFHMKFTESLVIGCIVCMSSTALVVKQLSHQTEVHTQYGLNAVGILLFQDLAFVPILVVISSLGTIDHQPLSQTLLWAFARGIFSIVLIIAIGRWLLQPLFHSIRALKAPELFTLAALFVALGSAWLTEALGMTYAMGAFLSGIMLGETEFRPQIRDEIRPFRDVLLGLFFVSVGMLANVGTWADTWFWIMIVLFAVMVGKAILVILLSQASGYGRENSLRSGIILAEGGEFGFSILAIALDNSLLPFSYGQVVLAALLISFAFAPILVKFNDPIARWIMRR
jgi:monovalent cation:H+ antiporter-2, CPA2 family